MRVSGFWIGVVGAFGLLLASEKAFACGPLPCAVVQEVLPADGSANVPLDPELRVRYFGALDEHSVSECGEHLARVRLWSEGAESPLELEGELETWGERASTWLVVKPSEPLLPNTVYRLELNVGLGNFACSCEGKWTPLSSFTTGAELDAEEPELEGVAGIDFGDRQVASNNCGNQDVFPLQPELEPASDDFPGVRYNLYVDGVLASPYLKDTFADQEGAPEVYLNCGTTALIDATLVEAGSNLEIRAVDQSGKESSPQSPLRVPDRCNASPAVESSGGCAVSRTHSGQHAAWLLAMLVVAATYEARANKRRSLARRTSTPGDSARARSMTLRSSRTLPGQS
jgi:hypothetical protein